MRVRLAKPSSKWAEYGLKKLLSLDIEPVKVSLTPVVFLFYEAEHRVGADSGPIEVTGTVIVVPKWFQDLWWVQFTGKHWFLLGRHIPREKRLMDNWMTVAQEDGALSAFKVSHQGEEFSVGSLFRHEGEVLEFFFNRPIPTEGLHYYGIDYDDLMKAVAAEVEGSIDPMSVDETMRAVRELFGDVKIEAPKGGEAYYAGAYMSALKTLSNILKKYVQEYEFTIENYALRGIYLSEKYMNDLNIYLDYMRELNERISSLEAAYNQLSSKRSYHLSEIERLKGLEAYGLSTGEYGAAAAARASIQQHAQAAAEIYAEMQKVAAAISVLKRKAEASRRTLYPLTSFDPRRDLEQTWGTIVLYPVITEVKMRGSRAEAYVEAYLTPEGFGAVSTTILDVYSAITHPILENPLLQGVFFPCAYGDDLIHYELIVDGSNVCSVCGVPICDRHRIIKKRKRGLLRREEIPYCPEHAPKK
ncbi:MAG: hypothetical protein F7C35_03250 [Desulfurococcales archaeon]|nr:hypothetical protein [Desulfurococcales archaeon]